MAPLAMFFAVALSKGPPVLPPSSTSICSCTSLIFANTLLFLWRSYQPTPVHPSHNPSPIPARVPPLAPLPPPCLLPPPSPDIVEKRARLFMMQIVKSFSMHTLWPRPALAPMPIAIDNGLLHITFSLGSDPTLDPTLCGLMDTSCGALNTGYLKFHLWLMSQRPDLVTEFISFASTNPFEQTNLLISMSPITEI